jgi:hypothetical protein
MPDNRDYTVFSNTFKSVIIDMKWGTRTQVFSKALQRGFKTDFVMPEEFIVVIGLIVGYFRYI